jgi:antitoxin MazE
MYHHSRYALQKIVEGVRGMRTKTQKWGNSLALRIPRAFAREVHLSQDTPVEMSVQDGRIVIVPVRDEKNTLAALLSGVTDRNIHRETDFGPAVGNEEW